MVMKRILITIALTAILVQFLGTALANTSEDCCKTAKSEMSMGIRYLPFFSYI